MLQPLSNNSKFTISNKLIERLQDCGLFVSLPSEDPHGHIHCVAYICRGVLGAHHLSMDVVGLRVFPFSLTGKAAPCLAELPQDVITSWMELQRAFLARFFVRSNRFKQRDRIISFQQFPSDSLHSIWKQYKGYIMSAPDHGISNTTLVVSFYRALDQKNQAYANAPMGGLVLGKLFSEVAEQMDKMADTIRYIDLYVSN